MLYIYNIIYSKQNNCHVYIVLQGVHYLANVVVSLTDPNDDTIVTLEKKTVTIPQGKPIATSYSNSSFSQSEYLIYKESQCRLRYMLKMKFG